MNELEKHIIQLARRNYCREEILNVAGDGVYTRKQVQESFTKLKNEKKIYQVDDSDYRGRRLWGAD